MLSSAACCMCPGCWLSFIPNVLFGVSLLGSDGCPRTALVKGLRMRDLHSTCPHEAQAMDWIRIRVVLMRERRQWYCFPKSKLISRLSAFSLLSFTGGFSVTYLKSLTFNRAERSVHPLCQLLFFEHSHFKDTGSH